MTFHVGQKVVCVDADPRPGCVWGFGGEQPTKGAIYTIRRVHRHDGQPVVWLEEISRAEHIRRTFGPDVGYAVERFRPVVERKTDISVFTAMLDNVPAKPRERVR